MTPVTECPTVLLCGLSGVFPYRQYMKEQAYEVAEKVGETEFDGVRVIPFELPFGAPLEVLQSLIDQKMEAVRPHAVIILGVYAGTTELRLEKKTVNEFLGKGEKVGSPLIEDGPGFYWSSFPADEVGQQVQNVVASTEVTMQKCNATQYFASQKNVLLKLKAGVVFCHLPYTEEQADLRFLHDGDYDRRKLPSMPFDAQVVAVIEIIKTWQSIRVAGS